MTVKAAGCKRFVGIAGMPVRLTSPELQ